MAELIGAHLLGSVPLGDARTVMATCGEILGARLKRVPDGETGDRTNWHMWQGYNVFDKNPAIITRRLAEDFSHWTKGKVTPQEAYNDNFDFALNPDAKEIVFGELGYAREALTSYATFAELKASGALPAQIRFQVSLPSPINPVALFMPDEADRRRVFPAYEAAMLREVGQICTAIPHHQLAIQWDCCVEVFAYEGLRPLPWDDQEGGLKDYAARLGAAAPPDVEMGWHLCYGDRRHTHIIEPKDLSVTVTVGNLMVAASGRPAAWLHVPAPRERHDAEYFAPLKNLAIGETELYLGLVHTTDGIDGTRQRLAAASAAYPRFGVATECGMGRRPSESIRPLLELHRQVLEGS